MNRQISRPIVLLFSWILSAAGFTQDISQTGNIIRDLTDSSFHGRGYVYNGDKLAADYILDKFKNPGAPGCDTVYQQVFNISVNTFPGQIKLSLDDKLQVPGKDFIIDAGSPAINGEYDIVNLHADHLLDIDTMRTILRNSADKFIGILPYKTSEYTSDQLLTISEVTGYMQFHPQSGVKGVILYQTDKPIWSVSTVKTSRPSITVKVDNQMDYPSKLSIGIDNRFYPNYQTQNVIGHIKGKQSDSLLVFTAHYDHLGRMGEETLFPGANDNASGVAMLISLIGHFSQYTPKYDCVFIAFGAEEAGLLGSKFFVDNPTMDLDRIKFLINLDIAGTGDDGIQVVNGSVHTEQFDLLTTLNNANDFLPQVKTRGKACNSDHCPFDELNVPCFFIYTLGGGRAYHDVYDRAEDLTLTGFEGLKELIIAFAEKL